MAKRHGMAGTPEYVAWSSMRQRCDNPNNCRYMTYGGRGIRICERWNCFENFASDMGLRPSRHHSLDRICNDGDYEPSNCRWATRSQQQRNKSRYTDPAKLPRGMNHWTKRFPERAAVIARRNIVAAHKSGSLNGRAKLLEQQVQVIKRRIRSGDTDVDIAKYYGVRPGTIWFIRTGAHWTHVS